MASIKASVSLLRIQSMSCRCDLSPELSRRRSPGIRPVDPAVDLGSAFRPSNSSTNRRSTSRMVSSTQRSSPPRADSMESGSAERSRSWKHKKQSLENIHLSMLLSHPVWDQWTYVSDERRASAQGREQAHDGRDLVAQFRVWCWRGGTSGDPARLTGGGRAWHGASGSSHAT